MLQFPFFCLFFCRSWPSAMHHSAVPHAVLHIGTLCSHCIVHKTVCTVRQRMSYKCVGTCKKISNLLGSGYRTVRFCSSRAATNWVRRHAYFGRQESVGLCLAVCVHFGCNQVCVKRHFEAERRSLQTNQRAQGSACRQHLRLLSLTSYHLLDCLRLRNFGDHR